MENTKEKREKTKDDFSLTAEGLISLGFTRYVAEDEVEFKQTGSYPVYYEKEFTLLNRNICASRNLQGQWEISISDNEGDILYYIEDRGLIRLTEEFEIRKFEVSLIRRYLIELENKLKVHVR